MRMIRSLSHGGAVALLCTVMSALSCVVSSSTVTEMIGAAGGAVALLDGEGAGAGVAVPAGALDRVVPISVSVAPPAELPDGLIAAGPTIEFGPSGTTFAQPVALTVPTRGPSVALLTRETADAPWVRVPGATYDPVRGVMRAQVIHFSPFVPMAGSPSVPISIEIQPGEASVAPGGQAVFTLSGRYSDGSVKDLTGLVTWRTVAPEIAACDPMPPGRCRGIAPGTTTVYVAYSGHLAKAQITVRAAPQGMLAITPPAATLAVGDTQSFSASLNVMQNVTEQATWTSSNPMLLSCSNSPMMKGRCTALGAGMVTVSATHNGLTATAAVTISPKLLFNAAIPTGKSPQAIASGDFNEDGKLDLLVANKDDDSVSLLLGDGKGGFSPSASIPAGDGPSALAVGDWNGDKKLDFVAVNTLSGNITLAFGNGGGGFGGPAPLSTGALPVAVAVGDADGDGNADLVVPSPQDKTVSVHAGDGKGNFGAARTHAVPAGARAVLIRDLDGDTRPDLIVTAGTSDAKVSVLRGIGMGLFATPAPYAVGTYPFSLVMADFNRDMKPDLAVANAYDDTVSVLPAGTGATFDAAATYPTGTGPLAVVTGDWNGDTVPDLAFAGSEVSVILNDGSGKFGAVTKLSAGQGPTALVAGDFNGDGKQDLAVANGGSNSVSVLLGSGTGAFQDRSGKIFRTGNTPGQMVVGDFDGDMKPDLAVVNQGQDPAVLLSDGQGGVRAIRYALGTGGAYAMAAGDFNGDNKLDLAVSNLMPGQLHVLLGNGSGDFGAPKSVSASGALAMVVGDFNGDNKLDLVATAPSNRLSLFPGDGAGGLGTATGIDLGAAATALSVADLNGDKKLDLVVAHKDSKTVRVLLGNGMGSFAAQTYPAVAPPDALITGDLNGDGKLDVAISSSGEKAYCVLLGDGAGGLGAAKYANPGQIPSWIAAADFDADGKLDLALADTLGKQIGVLRNDGAGGFSVGATPAGGVPAAVAVGDWNGDKLPDLAVAVPGAVHLLLNRTY